MLRARSGRDFFCSEALDLAILSSKCTYILYATLFTLYKSYIGAQGQDYSRQSDSEEVASLRSDVHPSLEQDLTPPLKTRLKVTSDFTLSLPRPHSYVCLDAPAHLRV